LLLLSILLSLLLWSILLSLLLPTTGVVVDTVEDTLVIFILIL
jgi:hypothetical protein